MTQKPDYYECLTCCDSGWIGSTRKGHVTQYLGYFGDEENRGRDKWRWDGPTESVEMDLPVAEPCPSCQKITRAAYEDGQLKYHLARRKQAPDEEEVRRRNVEKAKAKWDV